MSDTTDQQLWMPPFPEPRTPAEALATALSFEMGATIEAAPEAWLRIASGALLKMEDLQYVTHKWEQRVCYYVTHEASPTGIVEHRIFQWADGTAHSFAITHQGVGVREFEAEPRELRECGIIARGFDGRAGIDTIVPPSSGEGHQGSRRGSREAGGHEGSAPQE